MLVKGALGVVCFRDTYTTNDRPLRNNLLSLYNKYSGVFLSLALGPNGQRYVLEKGSHFNLKVPLKIDIMIRPRHYMCPAQW